MWIFDGGKPLKTWLIAPFIVGYLKITHRKDGNNNQHLHLRKVCKDDLSSVSVDNNNFPILLLRLNFEMFYR